MRRTALAMAVLIGAIPAFAQDLDRYAQYRQPPAVRAHYPDVPIALDTPALAEGRTDFTTQEELQDFVAGLAKSSRRVAAGVLGRSQQGRDIPYLIFTAEGLSDPAAIVALGRPIVWLIGQQHGNEPAGGEAMLAVASALARGELTSLTEKVTVVIVPRANPDGAAALKRTTANGADPNRDHLLMLLPETRALHALMMQLPPDVVLDTHEFTVANRWLAKFGAIQAVDALLLSATHPLMRREIAQLADQVFRPRIEDALKAQGLTSFDYYTTTLKNDDKVVAMGGNAPGAARNTFGLMNAISFLIETRGVGIGRESFQRRVATHYIAARSVLETAADRAAELRAAITAARTAAASASGDIIVAHKLKTSPRTLPMLDPMSGDPKPTTVEFRDSHAVVPTVTRAAPAGYALLVDAGSAAITTLRLDGIAICLTAEAQSVETEVFVNWKLPEKSDRESINPDQAMTAEIARKQVSVPAGTPFIPMRQPHAALAALALEPDSAGSLLGGRVIPLPASGADLPVLRVASAPRLVPAQPSDAAACR